MGCLAAGVRWAVAGGSLLGLAMAGASPTGEAGLAADQAEWQFVEQQQAPLEVLRMLAEFEARPGKGVPVEVTQDEVEERTLRGILDAFAGAQEGNYLLRQENIERLVIGSLFATGQSEETYLVSGVPFKKLRLVVNAEAGAGEIQDYFANPLRVMTQQVERKEGPEEEKIQELEGLSVSALGAWGRPRGLDHTRRLAYGSELAGRLPGTSGPDTRFNQYNFRYRIERVTGAEVESLDLRTGEYRLRVPAGFYGPVEVVYRVALLEEVSPPAQLVLRVDPPLAPVADTFDLRAGRPVDILYVVDNSSGTAKQQERLASSVGRFFAAFGSYNKRIRVAAVATSSRTSWRGQLLALPSGETMLSSDDPDFVSKVMTLIQPGAEEESRQSAILPTNNFFASATRREFFREGAFFSMIIVSEKDDDYLKTGKPEAIMRIYRHTMSVIRKPEDMRVDAVVRYGKPGFFGPSKQGEVYASLAQEFGGRHIDVTGDFAAELIQIGLEISRRAQEAFPLSQPPFTDTELPFQVSIGDQAIKRDGTDGWTYEAKLNRILLHGRALDDSFGQEVQVVYATIDREKLVTAP